MISLLAELARILQRKKNSLFSADVGLQQRYIKKLGMPKDDIERGYYQYRCQMRLLGLLLTCLYNLASIPLMLIYKKKIARAEPPNADCSVDAVFMFNGPDTILPERLKKEHKIKRVEDYQHQLFLTKEDTAFLKALRKRYPFAWHFRFKCLMKVAMYRYQVAAYQPETLIVSSEYSFTSSVLTAYCESVGVKHINVMHGEKLYYMRDSFFRFHECYVWDEHYKSLFTDMLAEPTQFIIAAPLSFALRVNSDVAKIVDYTYYLGAERRRQLVQIKNSLDSLIKSGSKVAIRPHPLYSDATEIQNVFGGDDNYIIENNTLPIEISVLRTRHAISCYSTVLSQAVNNCVNIVIDDVTDKEKYEKLKQLRYICLEKEHILLSDVLRNNMAAYERKT